MSNLKDIYALFQQFCEIKELKLENAVLREEARDFTFCKGRKCAAINGINHSKECIEDHESAYEKIRSKPTQFVDIHVHLPGVLRQDLGPLDISFSTEGIQLTGDIQVSGKVKVKDPLDTPGNRNPVKFDIDLPYKEIRDAYVAGYCHQGFWTQSVLLKNYYALGVKDREQEHSNQTSNATVKDPLDTPGNRNPAARIAGYKGQSFNVRNEDECLAYQEGLKASGVTS